MHPSMDITGTLGDELSGKKIVLCLTGSVAIIRSVDLARQLMRHGADVHAVFTSAAQRLIGPDLMEWATGNPAILQLTGAVEHVALAGNVSSKADLVLVAPATANTVGKIACGIDDTPVTTVVTTAIGEGIPVIVVPAMHEPMYKHPAVLKNLATLRDYGIKTISPEISEGKAKIAPIELIYDSVCKSVSGSPLPLSGVKMLITAGRTVEYLDPIRVFTNNSSGKMGMAIAEEAKALGARVVVVYGKGTAPVPNGVEVVRVDTSDDMIKAVGQSLMDREYDVMVAAAAVGDWKPKEKAEKKIATDGSEELMVELVPTAKIIDRVRDAAPNIFLVAFRALHALTREELIENAFGRMKKARADLIAVNDVSAKGAGFETDTNEIYIIDDERVITHVPLTSKREVARRLIMAICSKIGRQVG